MMKNRFSKCLRGCSNNCRLRFMFVIGKVSFFDTTTALPSYGGGRPSSAIPMNGFADRTKCSPPTAPTLRLSHSDTVDDLKQLIEGRIDALAKVHALFVQSRWAGAELHSLVTQELLPYGGKTEARVRFDGPAVMLEPYSAQAVAISLHELATNAAKYGALSVSAG